MWRTPPARFLSGGNVVLHSLFFSRFCCAILSNLPFGSGWAPQHSGLTGGRLEWLAHRRSISREVWGGGDGHLSEPLPPEGHCRWVAVLA